MTGRTRLPLVRRGLGHHWRVHAAVILGVATAVAVLGGALLVGESVRASLRDLALRRLGGVAHVVRSSGSFREAFAGELGRGARVAAAPVIAVTGVVAEEGSGRRASKVRVFGVDDRFWTLHGRPITGPQGREAFISRALAEELGAAPASTLLVTVRRAAAIPSSSLFGRRDDLARTVRVSVAAVLAPEDAGEFALEAQQQAALTIFVPLALLQRTVEKAGRVDTVLLGEGAAVKDVAAQVRATATLDDVGERVRVVGQGASLSVESETGLVGEPLAEAAVAEARRRGWQATGVLAYLANRLRVGAREVPYSVVAAVDDAVLAEWGVAPAREGVLPIVLNDWTARQLRASIGDRLQIEYYLWREEGRLETASADFTVAAIVPMTGLAADPDLVPEYPGITNAQHLADWDPPFPLDLGRVRPADEEYWARYRATPKAFIPLGVGQRLWGHRLGRLTSIRVNAGDGGASVAAYADSLRRGLNPLAAGIALDPVRERALASAQGATDFGAYFTYFSFFLVVAALLLAALFFRLGLEQRAPELGLMRAIGFGPDRLRRIFLGEAAILSVAGAAVGVAGAVAWAGALMAALRTWWVDAVGTRALALHLAVAPLAMGAAIAVACAIGCAAWTLRDLARASPRELLAGGVRPAARAPRGGWGLALLLLAAAAGLTAASSAGVVPLAPGFFAGAILLLAASLAATRAWLGRPSGGRAPSPGISGILWLGLRGAGYRPGRSTLCIALIAFATFLVVAVGTFRREAEDDAGRATGSGGYALIAESLIPIHHDLATKEGREEMGLGAYWPVPRVARFHLREGDDASCLNLYAPRNPRIIAPEERFLADGGFRFRGAVAGTDAEKANPWLLLQRDDPGRPVPVIADAASMEYVLHRKLGDEVVIDRPGGVPIRMRLVAALEDSVFQSELIMGEQAFRRLFPGQEGYRVFLLDVPRAEEAAVTARLESSLADQGFDAATTRDRLTAYHRVENTYLSTFQSLGALGLLLGTVGLATVLLRNALERRREIALLRALGYRPRHVSGMLLAENAALLGLGVGAGLAAAFVAVFPVVIQRGGVLPLGAIAAVAAAVIVTGLVTSILAAGVVRRSPLLAALRSE
jgi:ABC-type antimicrobial peptide transport system permease subunit